MRSFVPVIIIFLLLAAFCTGYTNANDAFVSDMYTYTDKLEKNRFSDPENMALLENLEDIFSKNKEVFSIFMNHDILEEAETHILRAKVLYTLGNEDLFRLEICTLKTHLGDILEEQKTRFSNILKK